MPSRKARGRQLLIDDCQSYKEWAIEWRAFSTARRCSADLDWRFRIRKEWGWVRAVRPRA